MQRFYEREVYEFCGNILNISQYKCGARCVALLRALRNVKYWKVNLKEFDPLTTARARAVKKNAKLKALRYCESVYFDVFKFKILLATLSIYI